MVLFRKEWEWVRSRIQKMPQPTVEFQTLEKRIGIALENVNKNPFFIAVTDNQMLWIEKRCKLVSFHKRGILKAEPKD